MNVTMFLQILAATVASLGFSLLFNTRGKKLIFSALGGGLSWTLFLLLSYLIKNEAACYFVVAVAGSLYAEIMARLLRSPATVFITISMIPLVPGASLYYTMSHALNGNFESFADKGLATVALAAAIAIGVIVSTVIMRIYIKIKALINARKKEA